jgi:methylated-DNA-[protein]-cysteine S-methyltransferase
MNQINIQYHRTEIGELVLASFGGKLCLLGFGYQKVTQIVAARIKKTLDAEFVEQDDEILERMKRRIDEYLKGARKAFDVPLLLVGSDFQNRVWSALRKVPYGTTTTYLQVARDISNEKAARAVGNALRANPIIVIVPCHRVIGSDGELTGYGGGLSVKKRLLELEQKNTALRDG